MAFVPKLQAPGNPIRAAHWNEVSTEVQRLENDKLNKSGGTVGPVNVQGTVTATGNAALGAAATVGATLEVAGPATLRSTATVAGSLGVGGTASVTGAASVGGAATFGSGATFAGNVRVGPSANPPQDALEVMESARVCSGSNPIRFTGRWSGFPDQPATNRAEISNDTVTFKTLMVVGNRSASNLRKVSVWDRLEVNGASCATSFCNLSDGRLKTDLAEVAEPLEAVSRLRAVSFRWRDGAAQAVGGPMDGELTETASIGVVAQEVAEVFPQLVTTMGVDDHLAVNYQGLTAVLLEAVKQLKDQNERLRERVDALERRGSATPGGAG